MLILIVGVAHTKAFVLDLATPAASQRHKGRIATDPLLTTRRLHSRRRGITTKATMLAGHRLGFHAVGSHGGPLSRGRGDSVIPRARLRGASPSRSLSPMGSFASQPETTPPPWPVAIGVDESVRIMSQLSKVTHSRNQWKHKATQRGDRDRYQRTQIARITAERDQATQALTETQARLRQLEAHVQGLVALPKADLLLLALQLL
jgi:hypothetical protein